MMSSRARPALPIRCSCARRLRGETILQDLEDSAAVDDATHERAERLQRQLGALRQIAKRGGVDVDLELVAFANELRDAGHLEDVEADGDGIAEEQPCHRFGDHGAESETDESLV